MTNMQPRQQQFLLTCTLGAPLAIAGQHAEGAGLLGFLAGSAAGWQPLQQQTGGISSSLASLLAGSRVGALGRGEDELQHA